MNSTFASVFISAADQAAAQQDLGEGYFTAPLSANGAEPATHYWSTGYWFDRELDRIVNEATWPKVVKFGDPQVALAAMNLEVINEPSPLFN